MDSGFKPCLSWHHLILLTVPIYACLLYFGDSHTRELFRVLYIFEMTTIVKGYLLAITPPWPINKRDGLHTWQIMDCLPRRNQSILKPSLPESLPTNIKTLGWPFAGLFPDILLRIRMIIGKGCFWVKIFIKSTLNQEWANALSNTYFLIENMSQSRIYALVLKCRMKKKKYFCLVSNWEWAAREPGRFIVQLLVDPVLSYFH